MNTIPVEVRIDSLLLRNLPHEQRHQVAAAVERALQLLVSERGLPPSLVQGGYIPHLRIERLQVAEGTGADAVGEQIAQAIYSNLARGS